MNTDIAPGRRKRVALAVGLAVALPLASRAAAPGGAAAALEEAFARAANEHGVPEAVLKAVSHAETRWDHHGGASSFAGGYGVMHLQDHELNRGLGRAARLLAASKAELRGDLVQNVRGGAALLAAFYRQAYRDDPDMKEATDLSRWYEPAGLYLQSPVPAKNKDFADHVFQLLENGVSETLHGGTVTLAAHPGLEPDPGSFRAVTSRRDRLAAGAAYDPLGEFGGRSAPQAPADAFLQSPNYDVRWRGVGSITKVAIHTCEGAYGSCVNTFLNPSSGVSAHYVVRASDGYVLQMVYDKDQAWHVYANNHYTVGIEHEGRASQGWFTDTMYRESAWVSAYRLYYYMLSTSDVWAHAWFPNQSHTDPGPYWNWSVYRMYVQQDLDTLNRMCTPGNPC